MKDLKKEAASLERQGIIHETSTSLMQDLMDKLFFIDAFEKNKMNGGVVKKPIMNAFQADSMMAFRVKYHFSDYVSSSDSDFGLYPGPDYCFISSICAKTKDMRLF